MTVIADINKGKVPLHVAVIMDGNGRWAQERGNDRIFGHQNGVIAVRQTVEAAAELGIKYLTLYAFSTENWNRPREEIDALMSLLVSTIHDELPTLNENKIQLMVIGDIESLPTRVRKQLNNAIENTSKNKGLRLVLALSYSGRWEILQALRNIAEKVKKGKISNEEIDAELFEKYLNTNGIPDPELLIRTSGEFRISNFLLWQIAYAEIFVTKTLWPDFSKEDLFEAIEDFIQRERRFGMVTEQLKPV